MNVLLDLRKKTYFFLFYWYKFVLACMYVHLINAVPVRTEDGVGPFRIGVTGSCEMLYRY